LLLLETIYCSFVLFFLDDNKSSKPESTATQQQPTRRPATSAQAAGLPNPFDFSAMTSLLNVCCQLHLYLLFYFLFQSDKYKLYI
jgi:hypothetical protein